MTQKMIFMAIAFLLLASPIFAALLDSRADLSDPAAVLAALKPELIMT